MARDACADGSISTDDVGRSGVGIDAEVDVAQSAQLCLKQHLLAGSVCIGQILAHIADVILEDGGILLQPCPHLVHADGVGVVAALHHQVLGVHHGDQALLHSVVQVQQVAHAQGLFHVLVAVSVGDAALGGAELCAGLGQTGLFQAVLVHMVGHGDGCTVGDLQVGGADVNALLAQLVDLAVQMMRVDDHTVAHDADDVRAQDAGGQQVQHELAALVLDRMASVVAALITCDDVILLADQVDHAALALIAPVDTRNCSKHNK